jgi:hypothetical protein
MRLRDWHVLGHIAHLATQTVLPMPGAQLMVCCAISQLWQYGT